jgi:uncharacterized protein (DUF342 family)
MTHIEYTLIAAQDLYQTNGTSEALHYKKGDQVTVNQNIFNSLVKGETIILAVSHESQIRYNKYDFENDVKVLKIVTEVGTAKLGQRNK